MINFVIILKLLSTFICFALSLETRKSSLPPYAGDHINIHIVTHTHDDTGWLITTDEYYIQEVQWIFETMIPVLMANPDRIFSYVEMAYFYRWWNEQNDETKENVLTLFKNDQLQINLGGWCMNDEATPSLSAIVHQMTDGAQFVLKNFGKDVRPTVGWHIDPFGHSWVTGGLWAEVGFDAFAMHRINYNELAQRKQNKDLEFIWKGSHSLGEDGYIFVHLMDNGYGCPGEINFGNGVYINTDPNLPTYGINDYQLAESFLTDARQRVSWFRHNHILIPFGGDFRHQNAYVSMYQMDKLIDYINSNKSAYNATIFYSSLKKYVQMINNLNLTWPVEDNDFFPYIDRAHSWWTGYFTSRPQLKLHTRNCENELRMSEQFYAYGQNMGWNNQNYYNQTDVLKNITKLRHAIDVSQHHDGVTGTETQHTTNDYMYMLNNGTEDVQYWQDNIAGRFLSKDNNIPSLRRDESIISQLTSNNVLTVTVYNPLAWKITKIINMPTNFSNLVVYDRNGNLLTNEYQTNMNTQYSKIYQNDAKYSLYWLARDLKPLSFTVFFIKMSSSSIKEPIIEGKIRYFEDINNVNAYVGSGFYSLNFNDNGFLSNIKNNAINQNFPVTNQWYQYKPSGGIYYDNLQNSGAYIFRPAQDNRYCVGHFDGPGINQQTIINFRHEWENTAPQPGFIAIAHGDALYNDSFITTICNISDTNEYFSVNYYKVKGSGSGWQQSPYTDFIAFNGAYSGKSQRGLLENKQFGTVSVSKPTGQIQLATISFSSSTFTSVPRLLVSVRSSSCDSYASYATTIVNVSLTGAAVYISRADSSTWNEDVHLDWMAWEPQDASETSTEGRYTVTLPANIVQQTRVNISFLDPLIVNEPVVLLSIRQTTPTINSQSDVRFFALTTVSNGFESFAIQFLPINTNSGATGNIQFEVTYWAFEREVLVNPVGNSTSNIIIDGPLLTEVQQVYKENYSQTYRVFNINDTDDLRYVEIDVHLGPLDQGAEFVTRFGTNFDNNYTLYTCQNGLEYVKRKYKPNIDERVGGNFFPASSQAWFSDNNDHYRLSTIVNQAHGVGAYYNSGYELMLHRRCLADDARGVKEVLNETTHIESSIYLLIDENNTVSYLNRRLNMLQQFKPIKFYTLTSSIDTWQNTYLTNWSSMSNNSYSDGLPNNIHLLSFRYVYSGNQQDSTGLVLQFEHMFENNESPKWSVNETINLTQIFNNDVLQITQNTEMTLTANLPLSELEKLSWNIETDDEVKIINNRKSIERKLRSVNDDDNTIVLQPRDIRTLLINQDP